MFHSRERKVDIVVKRQAVKPKIVSKLTNNVENIESKPMDLEMFKRHQRYMQNVERIAGKTWPEVAAEFESEMEMERKARMANQKKGDR